MFDGLKKKFAGIYGTAPEPGLKLDGPAKPLISGQATLRDTLFADFSLNELLRTLSVEAKADGPFALFAQAFEARNAGQTEKAVELLKTLTDGQEPRVKLLAWAALRELGTVPPSERAKEVLGVVVEVAMKGGEDLVAAYAGHTARYYNYSGAGVVWETDDEQLNPQIDALLESGRKVAAVVGPWEQKRPDIPGANQVRLNILTPSGLHFGEGPMTAMSRDPMGGAVIKAALELMQALIAVSEKSKKHVSEQVR